MSRYELAHTEDYKGFTINLYTTWEDTEPDWDFETEEDRQELIDKIESGSLLWFIAKVTASKNGVELAQDYLGGCCYESIDEFGSEPDFYYSGMRETVVEEAKKTIAKLVAA